MTTANDAKPAPVAAKQTVRTGGRASGIIRYNKFIDAWQCIDANRRMVLSIGSKEAAIAAYPGFIVKE